MGGYGSGRSGTRSTVENCLSVDANKLAKWKFFKPGTRWGNITWSWRGEKSASCGILVKFDDYRTICVFQYNSREITVNLSWYTPGFGGRRYFFLCPVCGQRMRTLHFRGGEIACRICHRLTYTSCNESHKFDSLFMRMARGDTRYTWKDYKRSASRMMRR